MRTETKCENTFYSDDSLFKSNIKEKCIEYEHLKKIYTVTISIYHRHIIIDKQVFAFLDFEKSKEFYNKKLIKYGKDYANKELINYSIEIGYIFLMD